jgi:uncharacterized protein (DUF1684 family)
MNYLALFKTENMIKSILYLSILLASTIISSAQENCPDFNERNAELEYYQKCIRKHRIEYINEFLENQKSPITANDTAYLSFFEPDVSWWLKADFLLTPDEPFIDFNTSSGKIKKYKQYALLHLIHNKDTFELAVYQSEALKSTPGYENYLFLPFTDLTNSEDTYGGGRYLDLRTDNFNNGHVFVDFNKTYNPYCAYSGGYSCPVPPIKNRLNFEIRAGEKKFSKPH